MRTNNSPLATITDAYLVWSRAAAVRRSWNMLEQDLDRTPCAYPQGEAQRGVWHHRGTWSHDWEGVGKRDMPPYGRGAHRDGYRNPAPWKEGLSMRLCGWHPWTS